MAEQKKGAPGWMVSFGDMMTLILTFFILLVALSKEQNEGLVAKGVGSFVVALRSFGLPGILDDSEETSIFENVRQRFNLPPQPEPEELDEDASRFELIRATSVKALEPHEELNQPALAVFEPGSAELSESARRFLDLLAPGLVPGPGQTLLLEGHASPRERASDPALPFRRASAVTKYLIEEHGFPRTRLQSRAWITEISPQESDARAVDGRLVFP